MASIVNLAEYRQRREAKAAPVRHTDDVEFFCTRCDASIFRITSAGAIHCVNCSAHMRNLFVNQEKR